jgi:hypothetical protein
MYRIINIIFVIGFLIICLSLFLSSLRVTYNNLKYFNKIRTGIIVEIEYREASAPQSLPTLRHIKRKQKIPAPQSLQL